MDGDNEPGPPNPGHLLLTHVPDWQCQGVSFAQQIPDIAQQVPELHRPDLVGVPFSHANIIQHVPHAHWQEPGSVPISQANIIPHVPHDWQEPGSVPISQANIIPHVPHVHWQEPGSVPISQANINQYVPHLHAQGFVGLPTIQANMNQRVSHVPWQEPGSSAPIMQHVPHVHWQEPGSVPTSQANINQYVPHLHAQEFVGLPTIQANMNQHVSHVPWQEPGSSVPIMQHVPHVSWQEPGSVPISQPGTIMEQHDTFMVSPCEPNFAQLGCSLPVQHAAQEPGVLPQAFMPASPSVQPSLVEEATPRGVQDLPGAGALLPSTLPPELVVAQRLTSDQSNQYAIVSTQKPQPEINKHPTVLAMPAKLEDLPEKVAVVKLDTGATMTASISKDADETVEWEWARAVSFMGMKTKKAFSILI